jgi:hypothetical protein
MYFAWSNGDKVTPEMNAIEIEFISSRMCVVELTELSRRASPYITYERFLDDESARFRIIDPVIMHIDIVGCRSGLFAVDGNDGDDIERCSDGWNRSSWDQPWRFG